MSKGNGTDPTKKYGSFTNSAGVTYLVHGLSPMLPEKITQTIKSEFERAGKLPVKPTYTVYTKAGDREEHEHDETTLDVPGNLEQTKLNQAQWREYSLKSQELDAEYSTRIMRAVLLAIEVTPTQAWRDEMKFMGIDTPPENSPAEKYSFIETEVIKSADDLAKIMTAVFASSGTISAEAVKTVEATFQHSVERAFIEAGKSKSAKQRVGGRVVLHRGRSGPLLEPKTK